MRKPICIIFALSSLLIAQPSELNNWFTFSPINEFSHSRIMMNGWLEKPAGKHGFVQIHEDKMICEDGTPIKFWGVNICSAKPYTTNEEIDLWVNTLSAFGINSVRFHKFTYHGMPVGISSNLSQDKYKRFDYFHSKLKKSGIYYGWSPIYGHKPRPGDKSRLIAYDEIKNADLDSHLSGSTIGLVNFSEDLQDLHIELIVNMLNHENLDTGLRYADDAALAFVEFQNEDNIFFASTERILDLCPTYKKILTDKFTAWLIGKYETSEKLRESWSSLAFDWGKEVKNVEWDLDKGNITPVVNHGIYEYEYKKYQSQNKPLPTFLLDMARFLYEEQVRFYKKFEKAIRETGYRGMLVGSCWQAGSGVSHYYNLSADYIVGLIDRHNYFGGGTGHQLRPGKMINESMLTKPGSGLLSMGMQQVKDRPFSISEWLSLIPNEWIAEASPIVAVYGMGLQGWDGSFSFASDYPFFTQTLHTPGVYNVMSPLQLSLYPALARMIYRNDIKQGEIISTRNVHIPSLAEGNLGFYETIEQQYDIKDYHGIVPQEALASSRIVVDFVNSFEKSNSPDLTELLDTEMKIVKSSTDQLVWDFSGKGFFTINSASTQGVVGFANEKLINFNDVIIQTENEFAIIIVTSLEMEKDLTNSNHVLVTTIARAKNSGMKFNENKTELIDVGEAPILIEPIMLQLQFKNRKISSCNILDHVGNRTGLEIKPDKGIFNLDGEKSKAIYYEFVLN